MSHILLVRHAQASFLEPDYDKLSPTGEIQARMLGEYWASRKVVFDRVYSGPRVRQIDTARIVTEICRRSQGASAELAVLPEFDEYQGEAVLERNLPALIESDPEIRTLNQAFRAATDSAARRRTFQKLFEAVIGKWVEGEIPSNSVESWRDFSARVDSGLTRFLRGGLANERVALFTSGGPIGLAVQRALELSSSNALRVSWMAQNCSFSEFLYSSDRFTMSSFNAVPHLDDASLQTYR